MPSRPEPIRTDGSNAFAHYSMRVRLPNIIDETIERNADYPGSIKEGLRALRDAIAGDEPIRLFEPPAPDHDLWQQRREGHEGETWLGTDWLYGEILAYRLVADITRYWTLRRDPFRPYKDEEMASDAMWSLLEEACALEAPLEERLHQRFLGALWGNRMDLSMKNVMEQGTQAADEHLLADDVPRAVERLLSAEPGAVHVVMDNAGTEQVFDYLLADTLLAEGRATSVTLHVKMSPIFVSDVLGDDVLRLLQLMAERGGVATALAERMTGYMNEGRLHVVPDFFWNTDGRLWELPPRLHVPFEAAGLVVLKGDANYRRATNDAEWSEDTPLAEAVRGFPAPLLALRTVKSDTLVGVDAGVAARLDREEEGWREVGTYGVAQFTG